MQTASPTTGADGGSTRAAQHVARPTVIRAYPPHEKQRRLLSLLEDTRPGIVIGHGVSGRGGGKTRAGALVMLYSCEVINPGCPHLWTAPTFGVGLQDTFLPTWREMIPEHMYTFKPSELRIYMHRSGSYIDLRSRYVDRPGKEPARGPSYAGAVLDEIREDPTRAAYDSIKNSIRYDKARRRWMLCITTPLPTWYQEQVVSHADEDLVVEWTSYDNPYLPRDIVDDFARDLTDDMKRQEILGQWVSQAGVVWSEYVDELWPAGNLHRHEWNPAMPYTLACDLGNRSAWLIIQTVKPTDSYGIELRNSKPIDVVVAEFQPDGGDTQKMCMEHIRPMYGRPQRICVGSDVNTGATTDGSPHTLYFRQAFGSVPVLFPREQAVNKIRQVYHAKSRLLNAAGERLLCISTGLRSHNPEKNRGIKRMMKHDLWPRNNDDFVAKDKGRNPESFEDTRDALLYYCICANPPRAMMMEMKK